MPRATDRKAAIEQRIAESKARQDKEKKEQAEARVALHQYLGELVQEYGLATCTEAELREALAMVRDIVRGNDFVKRNGHLPSPAAATGPGTSEDA